MSQIRVLRLLEYVYDSVETMQADMQRWGVQGVRDLRVGARPGSGMMIRSTTLPLEVLSSAEEKR